MMESMKSHTKRNYKRLKVKRGVFLKIRGLLKLNCKIIDISRGGLAFVYNDKGDSPGEKIVLDIYIKKNGFQVRNLSARVVSDSPVSNRFYFDFSKKRECHAQFVGLLQGEADRLAYFITIMTTKEISKHPHLAFQNILARDRKTIPLSPF